MATDRITPYGAFNFLVNLNGPIAPDQPLGGFSDVSGLNTEMTVSTANRLVADIESRLPYELGLSRDYRR